MALTRLGVWLLKLDVAVIRSRPYHPQGRGKNERFHRTLKAELLALRPLPDIDRAQHVFDAWRALYNLERPHESLGFDVPLGRYRPSARAMPEQLPEPHYDSHEIVRRVGLTKSYVSFKGRLHKVPDAFRGETLAIRPLRQDGHFGIFYSAHQVASIDLTDQETVSHVSEHLSAMSPG